MEGFYVEGFFFNPNIHPMGEYNRRLKEMDKIRDIFGIKIIEGRYSPREWFNLCRIYSQEKEGGLRCKVCYKMRLEQTYKVCKELGYDFFTTTLTVSPHKRSRDIFEVGYEVGGSYFLEKDFKKKGGFMRACELSRKYGFYHQDYCGCVYSLLERRKRGNKLMRMSSRIREV